MSTGGWQLKDAGMLSFRQEVHENDGAVSDLLQRLRLNYAELCNTEAGVLGRQLVSMVSHILLECEFGAGEEANRDGWFVFDGKAAG